MDLYEDSGAISEKRGDIEKQRLAFAQQYYQELRNSNRANIIRRMSRHSGFDSEIIACMLEHILDNTYLLWDWKLGEYRSRSFYPHHDRTRSLQRLYLGCPSKIDLIMVQHEALEHFYMNHSHFDYSVAHRLANVDYNYEESIDETN